MEAASKYDEFLDTMEISTFYCFYFMSKNNKKIIIHPHSSIIATGITFFRWQRALF